MLKDKIPMVEFPLEVEISKELIPEESPTKVEINLKRASDKNSSGGAFHEKSEKNKKTNQGGSYLRKKKRYKKPQTRGDKNFNRRNRNR